MSCSHLPGVTCDSCRYLTTAERSLVADSTYTDDVIAVMRDTITAQRETIAALRDELGALRAKFSGPRCDLCGNLCVDAAKDEHGYCPDCSLMHQAILIAASTEAT